MNFGRPAFTEVPLCIEQMRKDPEFEDAEGSSFDRYEFAFELKGDLLWDVGAGCAYRFHFAGDVEMNVVSGQEISAEGTEIVLESTQEFEGTIEYEIEVEGWERLEDTDWECDLEKDELLCEGDEGLEMTFKRL